MICFCAVHCPLSGYHEKACCDKTTCDCWCHDEPTIDLPPGGIGPQEEKRESDATGTF